MFGRATCPEQYGMDLPVNYFLVWWFEVFLAVSRAV
jgi:hypothetical protein